MRGEDVSKGRERTESPISTGSIWVLGTPFRGLAMWLSSKESACQGETQVQSLGQENPPKKEMATHSGILAWEIPWTEELGRLQSMGSQKRWT